ncbi:MAG: NAD-dependent malic enzyme [Acidobacteria bacterium]|nr:MAG: NAD-dependent malic enzyme [Acidobacteriota bacterium]
MESEGRPSAQYAVTIRLECPHAAGWIARIAGKIAEHGGAIRAIDLVRIRRGRSLRDYTIECPSPEAENAIAEAIRGLDGVRVLSVTDDTFRIHQGGKLEIRSKVPLRSRADLSMAYTPGVARVCEAIAREPEVSRTHTIRANTIAVVSDGSAVLGLGDIGPAAAMPVMEGKAILFKAFGHIDAFPLCIDVHDADGIVRFCEQVAPSFGGINLEDIAAPKCFEIERRLRETLDIPVFHDDQHGTAVVVLAAAINALRLTGRSPESMKVVFSGAGAAGFACTRALLDHGFRNVIVCDSRGAIDRRRDFRSNPMKQWLAEHTNPNGEHGSLKDVIEGADMFIGVSAPNLLDRRDIERMNESPIVFAMANPTPEVMPEEIEDIAAVVATGRSDYPNQINNVLAFPGIFRGALDARARTINEEMKRAAAHAIASVIADDELSPDYIVPSVFDKRVAARVAVAVAEAARASGAAPPLEPAERS